MTQKAHNKPVETIRDGAIKAAIWKNQGEKGDFYSVRITRTYQDPEGNYHDSDGFSGTELLKVAHVATKAYDQAAQLRAADAKAQQA